MTTSLRQDFAARSFERDGLGFVELAHPASQSIVEIWPERGAIVTRYAFGGREVLFLDRATLLDRSASIRGGIPLLFPSPGRLPSEQFVWNGIAGTLPQHGFARRLPWTAPAPLLADDSASSTLSLASTAATLAQYPWACRLTLRVQLFADRLALDTEVVNDSGERMPFGWGTHPYFTLPAHERSATSVHTKAPSFFDRLQGTTRPIAELDLTAPEIDALLIDHGSSTMQVDCPSNPLLVRCSPALRHWTLWLQPERDFFCVEPWTAPPNALNSGVDLTVLAPGERSQLAMTIVPLAPRR
jgi:galactose mutarotase-like enzyme